MELAKNKASISHELSTTSRGSILPQGMRGSSGTGGGRRGRNAFQQPEEFTPGDNGDVGGNNVYNRPDWDGNFPGEIAERGCEPPSSPFD
jgi:hypothetical protein